MANEIARRLRKTMTPHEVKLWVHLRQLRKREGWHFRRQAPFRWYILDFVCYDAKLVIELDGSHHREPEQAARDRVRDEFLRREGFIVLRFLNIEIDQAMDGVWDSITETLRAARWRMTYNAD
jgi:very-short-patch-repair endonuclease